MSLWRSKSDRPRTAPAAQEVHGESPVLIEDLFRRHNEELIRFLRARVGSYQEAREVAQEAYVRMLGLDKPGAVSFGRAFLFKTAERIAIDRQRRGQVHARAVREPLFQEFVDALTPERRVASEQLVRRLESAIDELPAKCQQAFVLHQVYGVEFGEIARKMCLSESMVRKYVMRGLLHCRTRIDEEEEPEHG